MLQFSKNRVFLVLIFLCLVIFVLDKKGTLYGVRNAAEMVIVPVQAGIHGAKNNLSNGFRILTFWKSGEERIKDLERRNLELAASCGQIESLKRENLGLRKQLEAGVNVGEKLVVATVISGGSPLIIDQGGNSGIKVGDTVKVGQFLVGVVAKVTPRRAEVTIPTATSSQVAVKIGSVRGVVKGQFGTAMIIGNVGQNEEFFVNDFILTSGEGSVSEPNLIVGKVGKIKSQESDVFKTAEVTPMLEYANLDKVFVIANN